MPDLNTLLGWGALCLAAIASARAFYYAHIALRAKRLVRELIQQRAIEDERLLEMIHRSAKNGLSPTDISEAIKRIEATAETLPQKEREIVHEGLHQHSVNGTKRFIQEVLAAA